MGASLPAGFTALPSPITGTGPFKAMGNISANAPNTPVVRTKPNSTPEARTALSTRAWAVTYSVFAYTGSVNTPT